MAAPQRPQPTLVVDTQVAGLRYANTDGSSRQEILARFLAGLRQGAHANHLCLVREPDNPHDANAIRVETPAGEQLGYLWARVAEEVAPLLDQGWVAQACIDPTTPELRWRPGYWCIMALEGQALPEQIDAMPWRGPSWTRQAVAGVIYTNRDGTSRQAALADLYQRLHSPDSGPMRLLLRREPDNPHDVNAIGVLDDTGRQIGYVRAEVAAILAPLLDSGSQVAAYVEDIRQDAPAELPSHCALCLHLHRQGGDEQEP